MPGFIKKTLQHHAWQGSEFSLGSEYTRILNMLGLQKFLEKMLHQRCMTGF